MLAKSWTGRLMGRRFPADLEPADHLKPSGNAQNRNSRKVEVKN